LYNVLGAECLVLPDINNGFVIDQTRKYFYGDEARVQCHRGFKLTGGPSIIKCGANQTFSNVPKCEGKFLIFIFVCFTRLFMRYYYFNNCTYTHFVN